MGTPAAIGIEREDGTVSYVTVDYGGMLSEAGVTLLDNYEDANDVKVLIALGELSSLGDTMEACEAYSRDLGEDYREPETVADRAAYLEDASWVSVIYLFTAEGWFWRTYRGDWKPLTHDSIAFHSRD